MAFGQYLGYISGAVLGIVGGVVGFIYGGPVGAAYGFSIGWTAGSLAGGIAGQAFWPERTDLNLAPAPMPYENRVQVSTWGNAVPIVYGSARLAGNIIYMSDIVETITRSRHRQNGVRYYEMTKTYVATFAVAFCEGPIAGISRIWMNRKVLVDWRSPVFGFYPFMSAGFVIANINTSIARSAVWFTIYLGSEVQEADPTIASILTAAETPAYRGVSYIVFKDFPVGEFSGLPNIEVEIGPQSMPEDFTTWTYDHDNPTTDVQQYEARFHGTRSGSALAGGITAPYTAINNFSIFFAFEIVSMVPTIGTYPATYNYAYLFMMANYVGGTKLVQVFLESNGAGSMKFCIQVESGGGVEIVRSSAYPVPNSKLLGFKRIGTTVSLDIYDGSGAYLESISINRASFTFDNFTSAQFGFLFQTGSPSIDYYIRNLTLTLD